MAITEQEGVIIGAEDLFDPDKVTPHLYAHLKMDEGLGDVLNDSSGNGHDLLWNTSGVNANASDAGIWSVDGLAFAAAVAHDSFNAANVSEYALENPDYSSVQVYQVTVTGALTANSSIASKRAAATGYMNRLISATNLITNALYDASGTVTTISNTDALVIGEKFTVLRYFDASTNAEGLIIASDTTVVQYKVSAEDTPSAVIDPLLSNEVFCIGQRGGVTASEPCNNLTVYNLRHYEDTDGGALPEKLGDIARWLHQNPTANIPAKWWS